jgi:hypothetical protein
MGTIMTKPKVPDEPEADANNTDSYIKLLGDVKWRTEIKEKAIKRATDKPFNKTIITMSQIGRIRQMLAEASGQDDFEKRIKSIKTDSVRKEAEEHFIDDNSVRYEDFKDYRLFWDTVLRVCRMKRKIAENEKGGGSR